MTNDPQNGKNFKTFFIKKIEENNFNNGIKEYKKGGEGTLSKFQIGLKKEFKEARKFDEEEGSTPLCNFEIKDEKDTMDLSSEFEEANKILSNSLEKERKEETNDSAPLCIFEIKDEEIESEDDLSSEFEEARRMLMNEVIRPMVWIPFPPNLQIPLSYYPVIPVLLSLLTDDNSTPSSYKGSEHYALFDTCCPFTMVCWGILPKEIRPSITMNTQYYALIRIGGTKNWLRTVVIVRPRGEMPHKSKVLLLGQRALIERMEFRYSGPQKQIDFISYIKDGRPVPFEDGDPAGNPQLPDLSFS